MESPTLEWAKIEKLLREMIQEQQAKVYAVGRRIVPNLTAEDLLQPNDYPELENHPHFRHEEGILAGLMSAEMAIRQLQLELQNQ